MKDKQIEGLFFGENKELLSRYITYLAYSHIINSLSKRDNISNNICVDHGVNYIEKFKNLYNEAKHPLGFLQDNIYNLYLYTLPHIKKIINNPYQAIIKEKKLIQKSKLKIIDSNTFKWLATKPGINFKEKLANQDKVLSTVKRYSYNTKENQVFVSYIYKLKNYFSDKKELIKLFPELFGDINEYDVCLNRINKEFSKINQFFKEDFKEVQKKEHATPNNTLIGNVDYSSIWNANHLLKHNGFNDFRIDQHYNVLMKCFMMAIMSSTEYDFMDKNCKLFEDDNNFMLYKITDNSVDEIIIESEADYKVIFKKNKLINGQYELDEDSTSEYNITFDLVQNALINDRGLLIKVTINDEYDFDICADLVGLRDFINNMAQYLNIKIDLSRNFNMEQFTFDRIALTPYNNIISNSNKSIKPHVYYDGNNSFIVQNKLYFSNNDNLYVGMYYDANKYNELWQKYKHIYKEDSNSLLIYDIKDSFDEFSSKSVRNIFSSIFPNSYPIWRSILGAESVKDFLPTMVIDLTGREVYATKIGRKKNLFVHKGVIPWPLNLLKYSEKKLLWNYIEYYCEDYNLEMPDNIINDCVVSGLLAKLLEEKKGHFILVDGDENQHEYYNITFDENIFNECRNEIFNQIADINEEFKGEKLLIIVPDYINVSEYNNVINNKQLSAGASVLSERVKKHQTAWYESLPDLDLEIIRNGYYDKIKLVENKECENIIGKSYSWTINETFVLTAGKPDYALPLIKSFIGEQNKNIHASINDASFPLKEDVEVCLKLSYCYGSENSYLLAFEPVNPKKSPFKKIFVDWKETETIDYLKELPHIKDMDYTPEQQENIVSFIYRNIGIINNAYQKNYSAKLTRQDVETMFSRLANDYQKMYASNYSKIKNVYVDIWNSGILNALQQLYDGQRIAYKKTPEGNAGKKIEYRLKQLEQVLIQFCDSNRLLIERKLVFPEACFGRYLVFNINDTAVIDEAYNTLILDYKLGDVYNDRLKTYIDRLTSATQMDHLFFKKMCMYNKAFVYKLLEVIIAIMKELSTYKFTFDNIEKEKTPKEISYYMRYCVELLISYLYVRDDEMFKDLRPDGKMAHEIINYIKIFNKNYQDVLDVWPEDSKLPRMETKYKMVYKNKPKELYRMWEDGYCLILYLSGAKEANNIIIGSGESVDD